MGTESEHRSHLARLPYLLGYVSALQELAVLQKQTQVILSLCQMYKWAAATTNDIGNILR